MMSEEHMLEAAYTYRGMIVEYWDLLRGDTSGWTSRPFFLKLIQESGEPALDIACGTGRLLLDYAAQGVDIDGVDISPEMVAACRSKARQANLKPHLYVQAMQALDLPRRYRTIIVPSSSFQHLTDMREAREALHRFHEHLVPGGVLSMSLRTFTPEPAVGDWEVVEEAIRSSDGASVRRWFRYSYDIPARLQSTEDRYEIIQDGKVIHSETYAASPYLTWYTASEALQRMREAGFVRLRAYSDFTDQPATDADENYVVVGERKCLH